MQGCIQEDEEGNQRNHCSVITMVLLFTCRKIQYKPNLLTADSKADVKVIFTVVNSEISEHSTDTCSLYITIFIAWKMFR